MEFNTLKSSGLIDILSDSARDIFLPQGIFHWSGRAKKEAEINATIGSAQGRTSHFLPGGGDEVRTFYLPSVYEALKALDSEKIVPYAPIAGLPAFREAWRNWIVAKLQPHYEFDAGLIGTPIVMPGATGGISYLAQLFLSPGESIICHDRHWENYDLIFEGIHGLKVETATLFAGGGLDVDALAEKVKDVCSHQKKAVIILNFPNNPTGYMPLAREGKALRDALISVAEAVCKPIVLIFDDAYEGYVYEENAAQMSLFGDFIGAHPGIIPIKCDGATKEFLLYGGRIACATFAFHPSWGDKNSLQKEFENKISALIRGTISNCNHAVQAAVTTALGNPEKIGEEKKNIHKALSDRYFALKKALAEADLSGAVPDPYNSGFFCSLNVSTPAEELADRLLKEYRVGVIPMVEEKLGINSIRIAFCSVELDMIGEMVNRISAALKHQS